MLTTLAKLVGNWLLGRRIDAMRPLDVGDGVEHRSEVRRRMNNCWRGTVVSRERERDGTLRFEVLWRDYPELETCWEGELCRA